jgi:hypothetical protein
MQSPEETFFAERVAAIIVPLHMARHNREWDSARGARRDSGRAGERRVSVQESHVLLRRRRRMLLEGRRKRYQANKSGALRSDNVASSQTLAVGCPFCMTQMEDALRVLTKDRRKWRNNHFYQ